MFKKIVIFCNLTFALFLLTIELVNFVESWVIMTKRSVQIQRLVLLVLAAVIVCLSIALAVTGSKYKSLKNTSASASDALVSAQQAQENLESQKQQEASSYQDAMNQQSSAYESEKNELNKKISELNRQIALKKATTTTTTAPAASSPSPTTPQKTPDLSAKTIYLTFDDGPSPRTPEVLRILKQYGVKATFFVINGGKYNKYMKDIVADGHTIALHSYSHDYKKIYSSESAYFADLQQISDLVYEQTGVRSHIVRFPGGSSNTVSRKYNRGIMGRLTSQMADKGYTYFDWNLSSGDANGNSIPKATIVNNCRKIPSKQTVVVLMHDAGPKKTTVEALPEVIAYYKAAGCKFGTLSESTPTVHQRVLN